MRFYAVLRISSLPIPLVNLTDLCKKFGTCWHTCAKTCAKYDPCFGPYGTHGDHFLNLELDIFPKNSILRLCNLLNIRHLCLCLSLHETIVSLSCALVCVQISLIIQDIFLLLYNPIIYVSG